MRKCPHCNTDNKDQAKFCRNCGKPLQKKNLKKSNSPNYNKTIAAIIVILIIVVAGGAFAVNYMNHQAPVEKNNPIAVDNSTNITVDNLDSQTNESNKTDNLTNTTNQTNESNKTDNLTTEINQTNTANETDNTIKANSQENNTKERTKISGIIFSIPEGYWEESFNTTTIEGDDASTTVNAAGKFYENKEGDTISIIVTEIASGDPLDEDHLKQYGEESGYDTVEMTINGKDGYYYVDDFEEPVWYDFIYLKHGKIISIAVSDENMLDEVVQ